MNALTLALTPALPPGPFNDARAKANKWRGRCLEAFARAEAAVTECLIAMAETDARGPAVRLPHLVGERLTVLATLIGAEGPFAPEGRSTAAALADFRAHDRLRTMLCHGMGKVTLDARGEWTLVLRVVALRSRQASRNVLALTQPEAEATLTGGQAVAGALPAPRSGQGGAEQITRPGVT